MKTVINITTHDVIIIGAGPAGAHTALGLAEQGFDVLVIDYRTNLGDKLCTGIISTQCLEEFPPSKDMILNAPTSATITTSSGKNYSFKSRTPQGIVIDRVAYVSNFSTKAKIAGAIYKLGERVTTIERNENETVVKTATSEYKSKVVVIASGFRTSLLTQVGIENTNEYMIGSQAKVELNAIDDVRVYLNSKISPGFFSWITPTENNNGLVGVLSKGSSKNDLRTLISHLENKKLIHPFNGRIQTWGIPLKPLEQTTADRVMIIGDAAGQVKPITGGGIYYSLLCSQIAVKVLSSCLKLNKFSYNDLSEYDNQWKLKIAKEINSSYYIRKFVEKLPNAVQTQLVKTAKANSLIEELIQKHSLFDKHSRLFGSVLGHPSVSWLWPTPDKSTEENTHHNVQQEIFETEIFK